MPTNNNDLEIKFGFVAVLDALGVRNLDTASIQDFYGRWKRLKDKVARGKLEAYSLSELYTFQDTTIICFETLPKEVKNVSERQITAFSEILSFFIANGLKERLFYRGAFSIGEYFTSSEDNLVLGPALIDAYQWSETLDMIGCLSTPTAYHKIISNTDKDSREDFTNFKSRLHEVSNQDTKLGKIDTFMISWPNKFNRIDQNFNETTLSNLFSYEIIPKEAVSKYSNSLSFYKKFVREHNHAIQSS